MLRLPVVNSIKQDLDIGFLIVALPRSIKFLDDVLEDLGCAGVLTPIDSFKQSFGPDYAMDEFVWALADRTHWETFLPDTLSALIALRLTLAN